MFRASSSEGDRPVAIKVFKLDLPPQRVHQLVAQFERLIAARLSRPGIALPIATGIEGNSAYLAQEFVAADSLDVIVRDYGAAEPSDAVRVATQLAGVLDFAAIAGVGHGALHPRDVLISQGETWMTGLGVEQALRLVGVSTPIRPPYTAPERLAGAAWDRRVDIFSLAGLIHDLLWGRRMTGLGEQVAASLRPLPGGDHESLRRTFSRALAKNPADRFGTAAEFAAALREAFPGIREAPQPHTTVDNEQPAPPDDAARALPVSVTPLAASEALIRSQGPDSSQFDDQDEPASLESTEEAADAPELASLRPLAVQPAIETLSMPQIDDVPSKSGRAEDINAEPAFAAPISEELAMFAEEQPAVDREMPGAPQQAPDQLDASGEPSRSAKAFPPTLASNAGEPRPASLKHEEREAGGLDEKKQPLSRGDEEFEDISFPEQRPQPEYAPAPGLTPLPLPPSAAEPVRSAMWPLALILVVGLSVGFASGYFLGSGDRIASVSPDRIAASSPSPTTSLVAASPATSTASASAATAAREFTEGAVSAPPAVQSPTPPTPKKASSPPQTPRPAPRASARTSAPPSRQAPTESSAGRLLVRTTPDGARVLVDGKDSGASPATVHDLARGPHRVRVIHEGFEPEERRIFITSSQPAQSLTIALSPVGVADSTPQATIGQFQGQLSVDSRPTGAKVFLDGKLVGTTPMMLPQIAAGEHVVRLDNDGYRRWSSLVRVVAGERNRVTASLEK